MLFETTTFEQEIGRRIRDARRAQGLTQEEVALAANVATRVIHYIEHGRVRPRLDTVQRLLSVLGMTLEIVPRSTPEVPRSTLQAPESTPEVPGSTPEVPESTPETTDETGNPRAAEAGNPRAAKTQQRPGSSK